MLPAAAQGRKESEDLRKQHEDEILTESTESTTERVERAIEDIRNGRMVILVDDEDRENEGDLVMAAELATPEAVNFMAVHGRGLICLSLTEARCEQLELPMMVSDNNSGFGTAFTVSIEARTGVTTGISAADRARTIRVAVAQNAGPQDVSRPRHVFLSEREMGVFWSGRFKRRAQWTRTTGRLSLQASSARS